MSLEGVRARLGEAALVLDFDGTLAPIVPRPEDARPLPGFAPVLARLVPRVRTLAVVTGRPSSVVRDRLDVDGLEVVGLYGLEGAPPVDPAVRALVEAAAAGEPGAAVEDKGAALAVHVRGADDPDGAEERLLAPLADAAIAGGLELLRGKRVLELTPRGGDKGDAVARLAARAGALLVAGDDLADMASFRAAARVTRALPDGVCRVAVDGPETPEELVALAHLRVQGPEGFLRLLASL